MSDKGFTYIEVIISFAVVIVIIAPVLSGFALSGRNLIYAREHYIGGLNANRLLLDIEASLANNYEKPTDIDDGDLNALIAGFAEGYGTDIYSYKAVIHAIVDGALAPGGAVVLSGGTYADGAEIEYSFNTGYADFFDGNRYYLLVVEVYDRKGKTIKRAVKINKLRQ